MGVAAGSDGALDVEGLRAELVVLESVERPEALDAGRTTLGGAVDELGRVAEHQVCCRVGVNGAVLADGVQACGIGAKSQGGDAVGSPRVGGGLEGYG